MDQSVILYGLVVAKRAKPPKLCPTPEGHPWVVMQAAAVWFKEYGVGTLSLPGYKVHTPFWGTSVAVFINVLDDEELTLIYDIIHECYCVESCSDWKSRMMRRPRNG